MAAGSHRHFWLDACRALAISVVLLSHSRHFLTPAFESASALRAGGFLGVELFFVLSGFLIGRIVWEHFERAGGGGGWLRSFWARRWLRTLPNYYLFLAVNAVLVACAIVPGRVADLLPFVVFMQNFAWQHPPLFGEAWSLAVEEVFYLTFPLCLLSAARLVASRRAALLVVVAVFLAFTLAAKAYAVFVLDPPWDEGIRKIVIFRLDALMLGVLGACVIDRRTPSRMATATMTAGAIVVLGGVMAAYFALTPVLDEHDGARILLLPATSLGGLLFVVCGLSWSQPPPILGVAAERCARWSYALYLVHMPVFHLLMKGLGPTPAGDVVGALLRWTLFMATAVLLAALVERFFERPILRWRDRAFP